MMTTPTTQIIQNYRVRNHTTEDIEHDELTCLVQFFATLEICKSCVATEIPKIQSAFDSNLDFRIDFEQKTLDISYGKKVVSGW